MLVLSRKVGEKILIGPDTWIMVCRVDGEKVRLGIDAPDDVLILRPELVGDGNPRLYEGKSA